MGALTNSSHIIPHTTYHYQIFAAASHGVGALTESSQVPRRAEVAHMGEGFFEGGRAFGANMLRGATGIVTKPIEVRACIEVCACMHASTCS